MHRHLQLRTAKIEYTGFPNFFDHRILNTSPFAFVTLLSSESPHFLIMIIDFNLWYLQTLKKFMTLEKWYNKRLTFFNVVFQYVY